MNILRTQDRDAPMTHFVSFHRVPMYRGTAFALHHIEDHGARLDIFSACRLDTVIKEHNREFHTHLMGQAQLVHLAAIGEGNPANPVNQTSHCGYADNVIHNLLARHGVNIGVGGQLPWWAWGLDIADHGKFEDVSKFLTVSKRLGYKFVQPYPSGSERHHVIMVESPIANLERWNVISKNRSAS
jgi:hypothetical protein